MPLPRVTIEGRLVSDPELRFTNDGAAVASFTVASNDRKRNPTSNTWEDGPTTFLRCSAWRDMAEHLAESTLTKGDEVLVTGRLTQREWEKDGIKRTTHEITVDTVGPSLRWRAARLAPRAERTSAPPAQDPWASAQPQQPQPPPRQAQRPDPWSQPSYDEPPF